MVMFYVLKHIFLYTFQTLQCVAVNRTVLTSWGALLGDVLSARVTGASTRWWHSYILFLIHIPGHNAGMYLLVSV